MSLSARSFVGLFAYALCGLGLVACGGGGGGSSSSATTGPTAEGAYTGTLSGSASSDFQLVVLENGEYWGLYGNEVGNTLYVAGLIQGSGSSKNGSFSSSNARDYGVSPAASGTVSASYKAGVNISGSVISSAGTVSLSGTAADVTVYDYSAAARLADITGAWAMTDLDGASIALSIAAGGSFSASSGGCGFTGTFAPHASGKNVFNVALTFGGSPCALAGQSASGIAIYSTLGGGATHQLIIAGVDASRTVGTAAFGTR